MQSIVIYDSLYGNTEKIALSIGAALAEAGASSTLRVGDMHMDLLDGVGILVVGSPTQGFRPTDAIKAFLNGIPDHHLKGSRLQPLTPASPRIISLVLPSCPLW